VLTVVPLIAEDNLLNPAWLRQVYIQQHRAHTIRVGDCVGLVRGSPLTHSTHYEQRRDVVVRPASFS